MLILGIETSCDETSAAVVETGRTVRSNIVASQVALHAPYGGVVPEIASRHHLEAINGVVRLALSDASVELKDIEVVAATHGPGLAGALLVGVSFGRGLARGLGVPFRPVNHLEGHLYSVWLDAEPPPLPLIALIVSGGHTQLVLMRGHGEYDVVGRTLDDAAGEAFDKVARLLGLEYPGGPAIQRAAGSAVSPLPLPRAWLPGTYNFSFSGLKTATLHAVHALATEKNPEATRGVSLPRMDVAAQLTTQQVAEVAAGFQESVVDVLVRKTARAARDLGAKSAAVVGGVAANRALRESMAAVIDLPLRVSPPHLATDNAAMIAAAAYFVPRPDEDADIRPNLQLAGSGQLRGRPDTDITGPDGRLCAAGTPESPEAAEHR